MRDRSGRCLDEPVVPDSGGGSAESGGDSGGDTGDGAAAVVSAGELAFHGVKVGLDPLADAAEFPESEVLVFPVGSNQFYAEFAGDESLYVGTGEAFVGDDDLPGENEVSVVAEEGLSDLGFSDFGFANPQTTGMPSDAQGSRSRNPQN